MEYYYGGCIVNKYAIEETLLHRLM